MTYSTTTVQESDRYLFVFFLNLDIIIMYNNSVIVNVCTKRIILTSNIQLVSKLRLSPIIVTLVCMPTIIIILQNIIYLCADKISTASLHCNDNK